MSKITELKYTYRKNLGNYEHEETTVGGILEEGSNPVSFLKDLKALAQGQMNVPLAETPVAPPVEETVAEKPVEKTEKKSRAKKEEKPAPEPEQLELEVAAAEAEETKSEVKPEPVKKSKVTPKSKNATYDRSNDLHKKFFGEILDQHFPGWKTDTTKAKEVSKKLEGTDMLSSEGLVLPSFEQLVIQGMKN